MALRCQLVDDSAPFLRAAREVLEREGLSVVAVASTGTQAVRQARELSPDLALVDIELGGESGFDLAERMAGAAGGGRPRVILISSYAESDFAELVAASPALAFLPKSHLSGAAIRGLLTRAGPLPMDG